MTLSVVPPPPCQVNTLIPHVSSADARQQSAAFMALSGLALRFTATMVDGDGKLLHESDRGRAFVVALHLEDDTLALYEVRRWAEGAEEPNETREVSQRVPQASRRQLSPSKSCHHARLTPQPAVQPQTRERPASRYLERTSVPKPGGQGKLGAADCYVGASIAVFGRTFVLTGADAWSENYMAAHPKVWGSGLEF